MNQKARSKYRYSLILLKELVITDFKLRYQGSVLGYAWSLLKPLFMFLILYTVFGLILKLNQTIPNYPIYLLLGILMWSFFSDMTQQSLTSIVARGDLIQKIRIPRWLMIVSASLNALINLTFNFVVLFGFVLVTGMDLHWSILLTPFFLLEVYLFALGISLILAALYVKYRDVSYIWDVVLQAGFYGTPILYSLALVKDTTIQQLIMVSPMSQAIQGAREVFISPDTISIGEVYGTNWAALIPLSMVVVFLVVGVWYFRKEAKNFAENL